MDKPCNGLRVPCEFGLDFFKKWFTFLKPLHDMSNKEIEVMATITMYKYELETKINDSKLAEEILFNEDTRRKIRTDCDLSLAYFQVVLNNLRKKNVIIGNKINTKLLPNNLNSEGSGHGLMIFFDFNDKKINAL